MRLDGRFKQEMNKNTVLIGRQVGDAAWTQHIGNERSVGTAVVSISWRGAWRLDGVKQSSSTTPATNHIHLIGNRWRIL